MRVAGQMTDVKFPHKFIHGANGTGAYDHVVFCEYCGLIAFDANRQKATAEGQEKAAEGCKCNPNSISFVEVYGG